MLGTIEDLEKDIELFQKNIAASGEMVQLLKQMLEQIKLQNKEFEVKSQGLIFRVDELPSTINDANSANNSKIKSDVASELEKSLQSFAMEQTRYLQGLELTKQQIQNYVKQIQAQEKMAADRVSTVLTKVDRIPSAIEAENLKNNALLKDSISLIVEGAVRSFSKEQENYIAGLIKTQANIEKCEERLEIKYKEFIDSLEKMNISNLYEQNVQLKSSLDKRTLILMLISGLSVVIGIVGLFI